MTAVNLAGPIALNRRAEQYVAQLCANLYISSDAPPKCVALTAADRKAGKTSLGLGLAVQVVQLLNANVVFVEGNLRGPRAYRLLGVDEDHNGLADILSGTCPLDQAVVSLGEGLGDVIPAGRVDDHDRITGILNTQSVEAAFAELAKRYEYIIVETPAINIYPEAQVLLSRADRAVLVVRAGATSREAAGLAAKRIELCGAGPPAIVLNRKRFHVPEFIYKRL